MLSVALAAAICAGIAMSLQSPTNASLSRIVGSFQAALVSFSIGVLCLIACVALAGRGSLGNLESASWWQLLGGAYGSFAVVSTILATPRLGVALTMAAAMLGQLAMGVCVDAFGLLGASRSPVDLWRILGCLLVAGGILLAYKGNRRESAHPPAAGYALLMTVAGMGTAIQAPTNASLAQEVGLLEASLVSFSVGLAIVFAVTMVSARGKLTPLVGAKSWQFLGGFYGAAYVAFVTLATPQLGVNLAMSLVMLGQLLGGGVIDSFGLLRTNRIPLNRYRIAALATIAGGVLLIWLSR